MRLPCKHHQVKVKVNIYNKMLNTIDFFNNTPSPYIAEKHGIDSFTMVVDSSTGILLDFQGTLGGSVSRFMTVKECLFEAKSVVKQFNLTEYEGYEEITGW